MTQYETRPEPQVSGWAIGGLSFAAVIMIMIGTFQALAGLAAIFEDEFFVLGRNYAYDLDVTAWGWIHLLLGIVILIAGFSLFAGRVWAAFVAITLAVLSSIANFFFIPYEPFWALLIIALNVWVIWSLTRPAVIRT